MREFKVVFLILFVLQFSLVSAQNTCSHKHTIVYGTSRAANDRSDTVDVLNYAVNIDLTDFSGQILKGNCIISFTPRLNNVSTISLDLLEMTVDSVTFQNQTLNFSYDDTLLIVQLANSLNNTDTSSVQVYYRGSPQQDASGWGGWYWQGSYSYNLGVGFNANPHNYGRVWYPCFDNFVERASYDISILSSNGKTAYANGYKVSELTVGTDSLLTTWRMDSLIPTYLSCVTVGNYTHVEQSYTSAINGSTTPVYLIAEPADTNNMKSSFVNLFSAIEGFEDKFGPYLWNKIGYHLVPFNSGAMEHATSIAYPRVVIDGSIAYQTLMAHELSHHWWGNLVTCRTAEDMWINEGMASYSEKLFLEYLYGYDTYIDEVKSNHKEVLHHAHINDNGYFPLHGVPTEITYGDHTYNKGSDVAHTMRSYMGDTEYFNGLQSFLEVNKFSDVDAYDFVDHLNANTSVDMTDFFNDWIFNPGFTHFSVDSMEVVPNGANYDVTVYVRQKLKAAPNYYSNVPMDITFKDANWSGQTESAFFSGQNTTVQFTLPFEPVLAYLNEADKISQAVTGENVTINSLGAKSLLYSFFTVTTTEVPDSASLRIEHHWVAPDDLGVNFMYNISQERYWSVEGLLPSTIKSSVKFYFNGKNVAAGNLDNQLVSLPGYHEDSMVMFYREKVGDDWQALSGTTINNIGTATDGYGFINVDSLRLGEYAFGFKKSNVAITEIEKQETFNIYPNPTDNIINIDLTNLNYDSYTIRICDVNGRLMLTKDTEAAKEFMDISNLNSGHYIISVLSQGKHLGSKTLIRE